MRRPGSGLDVIVVGGGIAGLTAALHCALRGRTVAVLEGELPGGLIVNVGALEGLPGPGPVAGAELAAGLQGQLTELGVDVISVNAESVEPGPRGFVVRTTDGDKRARCVVAATGARLSPLPAPGAEILAGKGVSQCAFCDAGLYLSLIHI